jgi:hypothetical protein
MPPMDPSQLAACLCPVNPIRLDDLSALPKMPGLYALHASPKVWQELGLDPEKEETPLYVGKAEESLRKRVADTHLNSKRTGSSTLRRSFAALLHHTYAFRAVPRKDMDPTEKDRQNYKLATPEQENRLTGWMRANLSVAVWTSGSADPLADIEDAVVAQLTPPLNVDAIRTKNNRTVKAAREKLQKEARSPR